MIGRARARACVCALERAALTRRPRCQRPLAWRWRTRRLSGGPLCPEEAPHPALGQLRCEALRWCAGPCPGFVPIGIMRAQPRCRGKHRCAVRKGLRQRGCIARCVWLSLLPFLGRPSGRNAARFANTAKTVLWGRPCLALRPSRAFAFGQGVRGAALGGVRPWNRLLERVVREWNSPQHCF